MARLWTSYGFIGTVIKKWTGNEHSMVIIRSKGKRLWFFGSACWFLAILLRSFVEEFGMWFIMWQFIRGCCQIH